MNEKETFSNYFEETEGELRLILSAGFVILLLSLLLGHLLTKNKLWRMLEDDTLVNLSKEDKKEKIYDVLVEQQNIIQEEKDEYKALSDKSSAGAGGLTKKEGFHTLSQFREFVFGNNQKQSKPQPDAKPEQKKSEDDLHEIGIYKYDPLQSLVKAITSNFTPASAGQQMKIPFNYRFQQDFLFRWDGSKGFSVATKELAGYRYFKNMLKQIESSFAPPGGGNIYYRDMAGTVIQEGIKPGMAKVQFMLDPSGKVVDVRLVGSQGQQLVDQACVDSIRGQNFGKVPEEVYAKGNIFGINFIFPEIFR